MSTVLLAAQEVCKDTISMPEAVVLVGIILAVCFMFWLIFR